jgi:hypothetical protein
MPTVTIDLTGPQAARVADAYGDKLGLGVPVNMAQFKAHLIEEIKGVVRGYEHRVAINAAVAAVAPPEPIDPT